jgi:hypothetical protein
VAIRFRLNNRAVLSVEIVGYFYDFDKPPSVSNKPFGLTICNSSRLMSIRPVIPGGRASVLAPAWDPVRNPGTRSGTGSLELG